MGDPGAGGLSMSYILTQFAKYGFLGSKSCFVSACMWDATLSERAWSTQYLAAYSTRGDRLRLSESRWVSIWSRTLRHACARIVCASSRLTRKDERRPHELARRSEVKNSFTEGWENCTTLEPSRFTTSTRLEQIDSTACSGSSGRQSVLSLGIASPSSKSTARISASSSTRSGLMATVRQWKRR